ncbi:MAG TPA: hypothetical protein VMR99_01275 [Candidatus Paceibacterota bacterium]|nr:hypothetical protein [Candidatus Paceibacterota bacterium]
MGNSSTEDRGYKKTKQEARELYTKIGRVWCPALNEYINFNRVGFEHLMRRGMKWRSKDDQIRRFRLLRYAKNIIRDEGSVLVQRDKENVSNTLTRFWAVTKKMDDRSIVVIIRQTKMGQKHFLSIYNQKTAQ